MELGLAMGVFFISSAAKMAQFFRVVLTKVSSLLQVSNSSEIAVYCNSEVRKTEWKANYSARQKPET